MKKHNKHGFTLLELLIVVLIIGILTAITMPFYLNTIERTRAAEMQNMVRDIALAQQRIVLAKGAYADRFEDLDIGVLSDSSPASAVCGNTVSSADAIRRYKNYEVILNNSSTFKIVSALRTAGDTQCGGFFYFFVSDGSGAVPLKKLLCSQMPGRPAATNKYCQKVGYTQYVASAYSFDYYTQP